MPVVNVDTGAGIPVSTRADPGESSSNIQRMGVTYELTRISQTPTISAGAIYAAGDAVGGLLTFANAARGTGGSGRIVSVQLVDKDQERADLDLVLFDQTFGPPVDNTAFDPTDAEMSFIVGWIPIGGGFYTNFVDNAVAHIGVDLPYVVTGTSLFGALVVRGTPTYTATTDIVVTITVARD